MRPWSPEKDVRHSQPLNSGGRVYCGNSTPPSSSAENVSTAPLSPDRSGKPRDRVYEHHRGKLAAGEDVRADGDRVGGHVLDDALVEAFETGGEKGQLLLAGELLDELLVELPTLRRERDDRRRPRSP